MGDEPLQFLNVGQLLKITAIKYPDREAIVSCSENVRLTFSEALRKVRGELPLKVSLVHDNLKQFQADKLAAGFLNIGLEKGDRVVIWSPNYGMLL